MLTGHKVDLEDISWPQLASLDCLDLDLWRDAGFRSHEDRVV